MFSSLALKNKSLKQSGKTRFRFTFQTSWFDPEEVVQRVRFQSLAQCPSLLAAETHRFSIVHDLLLSILYTQLPLRHPEI